MSELAGKVDNKNKEHVSSREVTDFSIGIKKKRSSHSPEPVAKLRQASVSNRIVVADVGPEPTVREQEARKVASKEDAPLPNQARGGRPLGYQGLHGRYAPPWELTEGHLSFPVGWGKDPGSFLSTPGLPEIIFQLKCAQRIT